MARRRHPLLHSSRRAARPRPWGRSALGTRTHGPDRGMRKVVPAPRVPSPARPHDLDLVQAVVDFGELNPQLTWRQPQRATAACACRQCAATRLQGRGCGAGRGLAREARRQPHPQHAAPSCVRVPSSARPHGLGLAATVSACRHPARARAVPQTSAVSLRTPGAAKRLECSGGLVSGLCCAPTASQSSAATPEHQPSSGGLVSGLSHARTAFGCRPARSSHRWPAARCH